MRTLFLLSLFLLLSSLSAQAWEARIARDVRIGDTTQLHQLILLDYSKLRGTVIYANADSVRIQLDGLPESVAVPTAQMRHIGVIAAAAAPPVELPERSGMVPFTDLTLLRTALPYQRRMRLKTVMLVYNTLEWNLNRHFQLSAGIAAPVGIIVSQRFRTSLTRWLHVGLSNEIATVPFVLLFDEGLPLVGDLTSMLTIGDDQQFFHVGAGMFYVSQSESVANYRVGMGTRLGEKTHLYGELLAVKGVDGSLAILPSFSVAVASGRHRWSFGMLTVVVDDSGIVPVPLPYLSYSLYY